MAKKITSGFIRSVEKISNIGDVLLSDEKLEDWEIDTIIVSSKSSPEERVECSWVKEGDKWVKKCRKV